jgi:hypothetical protein
MERLDYWRLCDDLTVLQAALLLVNCEPLADIEYTIIHGSSSEKPNGCEAALAALSSGLRRGEIEGKLVPLYEHDINGNAYGEIADSIDIRNSRVEVESVREFLLKKGFTTGFFVSTLDQLDGLADRSGQFYAPKLAAAVRAWNEVTSDRSALNGKTPKKALEIWLRKHANEYGLTNKDGLPNELGIEEICKVANWKLAGGASPTPDTFSPALQKSRSSPIGTENKGEWGGKVHPNPPTPKKKPPTPPVSSFPEIIDDDIPF